MEHMSFTASSSNFPEKLCFNWDKQLKNKRSALNVRLTKLE